MADLDVTREIVADRDRWRQECWEILIATGANPLGDARHLNPGEALRAVEELRAEDQGALTHLYERRAYWKARADALLAERESLRDALARAADDLGEAANQFDSLALAGKPPENNGAIFAEKESQARARAERVLNEPAPTHDREEK